MAQKPAAERANHNLMVIVLTSLHVSEREYRSHHSIG